MKTYRNYVTDPEGGVIPFGYPQADIYCEAVYTVHCDRYGSEGIAVTRRRNGEGVVMGVRGKQIDRLMVPRRQWTGFVAVAFLFASLSGLNASLTLAADLAKGGAVAEPESLLDEIFGPPDNCLPKKPFYYDVRAKQSRYGDEIGVLEKLGAVGEQMKDFPEFYEFKLNTKFSGLNINSLYLPTVFGGYGILFDRKTTESVIRKLKIYHDISIYSSKSKHNSKSNNAYLFKFENNKIVYNCPQEVEGEGD